MCFGCSKEPSHRDGYFEYPQHMFWLRNKKNNFQLHTLIWGPGHGLTSMFVTSFKPQNNVTLSNTITDVILQWHLTSASEEFLGAFKL